MRRGGRAALAAVVLTVLALAWSSAPAAAHPLLEVSTPADGDSVERAPSEVVLTFTEPPDLRLTAIRVVDASGGRVEAGGAAPVAGQPSSVRVPLRGLVAGTYTVTWRTTSADGHTTSGSVGFGVGVPAPPVATAGGPEAPASTVAGAGGRWLFYLGVVMLVGAAAVGVAVVRDVRTIGRGALAAAWVAAAGGTVLTVFDQRARAEASLGTLLSSSTGHKLAVQAAAVAVTGLAAALACLRPSRAAVAVTGAAASGAMLARALAGHADASTVRWFTVGVQWIHLVSAGVWVGGLVWLLLAIRGGDPGRGRGLARRFSSVAGWALAATVVSGSLRAVDEVGAWDRLFSTDFGVALVVKVGLVAALVALGALGRFRHVPAAAEGRFAGLRRLVRGEVGLAAAVLGATAALAGFPPSALVATASTSRPAPAGTITVTGTDVAASVRVQLVVSPGLPGPNRFVATVAGYATGEPLAATGVTLRFRHADLPDVAGSTLDLTAAADGHWRGAGRGLSFPGRWTVTMAVQTATDAVEVPLELRTRRPATGTAGAPGGGGNAAGCDLGEPDPAYQATVAPDPNPPSVEGTTFRITVRRDGSPVTGAKVCLTADMPEMQHPAVSKVAKELSGGRYEVELKFEMGGAWAASVVIAEPGRPVALVPMRFLVR